MQDLDEMFETEEEWSLVQDFPEYAISNYGKVITRDTGRIRRPSQTQRGLLTIVLFDDDGRPRTKLVSRLVAQHFLPQPHPFFDTPINLNGDRANCHVANLMWRTRPFAIRFHRQYNWDVFHADETRLLLLDTSEEFDTVRDPVRRYGLVCTDIWWAAKAKEPVPPTNQKYRLL